MEPSIFRVFRIFRRYVTVYSVILGITTAAIITLVIHQLSLERRFSDYLKEYGSEFQLFAALSIGLSAAIPYLLRYLRPSARVDETSNYTNRQTREARDLLVKVQNEIADFRQLVVSRTSADQSIDTSGLVEELRATLIKNVAEEIRKEFESQIAVLAYVERIRQMFVNDERRLFDQIAILRKRGNLNLVIGVVTTLLAAITLVFTITFVNPSTNEPRKIAVYFTSRISTVIFIEVFSFFFLRLYKSTLEEVTCLDFLNHS